jgi:hypothetical protein
VPLRSYTQDFREILAFDIVSLGPLPQLKALMDTTGRGGRDGDERDCLGIVNPP